MILTFEWTNLNVGMLVALALTAGLLVPFLIREIREGKRELGPLRRLGKTGVTLGPATPTGAGDNNPGRRGDPAPGEPTGQDDPYSDRAQRHAPPVKS